VDLEWNPEDFGGIKTILLPYDSIWLPDILLYNRSGAKAIFEIVYSY